MSSPKITRRSPRLVKVEHDPYHFSSRTVFGFPSTPIISRKVYDDGSTALFVGASPVRSIRYERSRSSDIADYLPPLFPPDILLDLEDGSTVRLRGVRAPEEAWLHESIRRIPQ